MASVSLPYAKAFEQVAAAQHLDREAVRQQLGDFSGTVKNSRGLNEFFSNPSLPHTDKLKVLDAIGGKLGFVQAVRNFIAVLIDHQRLELLDEVVAEYLVLSDEAAGIHEAEITSARDLSDADKQVLAEQAARLAGSQVRVVWKQDPALLGGAVVKLGATVYDGSVRAQLNQMRQHLAGAR